MADRVILRPFFPRYGSMWAKAKGAGGKSAYPGPRFLRAGVPDLLVERFAGSAGWSLVHGAYMRALLVDSDEAVCGTWAYLIGTSASEVMRIPDVAPDGSVDDLAGWPQEVRWLVGFWLNRGKSSPAKRPSKAMREGFKPSSFWGEHPRRRIASQLSAIRRWRVVHGNYDAAAKQPEFDPRRASVLDDPPFLGAGGMDEMPGRHYRQRPRGTPDEVRGWYADLAKDQDDLAAAGAMVVTMDLLGAPWRDDWADAGTARGFREKSTREAVAVLGRTRHADSTEDSPRGDGRDRQAARSGDTVATPAHLPDEGGPVVGRAGGGVAGGTSDLRERRAALASASRHVDEVRAAVKILDPLRDAAAEAEETAMEALYENGRERIHYRAAVRDAEEAEKMLEAAIEEHDNLDEDDLNDAYAEESHAALRVHEAKRAQSEHVVVLVCGGREFEPRRGDEEVLRDVLLVAGATVLRHGGARGADTWAARVAYGMRDPFVGVQLRPADWKRHGKSAGHKRNREMLEEEPRPSLVVATPGGRGTAHMVGIAEAAGVTVRRLFVGRPYPSKHEAAKRVTREDPARRKRRDGEKADQAEQAYPVPDVSGGAERSGVGARDAHGRPVEAGAGGGLGSGQDRVRALRRGDRRRGRGDPRVHRVRARLEPRRRPDGVTRPPEPVVALERQPTAPVAPEEAGDFRYRLERGDLSGARSRVLAWVMLNPSTADDREDDATIRRVKRFTEDHGYAGLVVVNLFARRATRPVDLRGWVESSGLVEHRRRPSFERNMRAIREECSGRDVVLAWGGHARSYRRHVADVLGVVREAAARVGTLLRLRGGDPAHPLHLRADLRVSWDETEEEGEGEHGTESQAGTRQDPGLAGAVVPSGGERVREVGNGGPGTGGEEVAQAARGEVLSGARSEDVRGAAEERGGDPQDEDRHGGADQAVRPEDGRGLGGHPRLVGQKAPEAPGVPALVPPDEAGAWRVARTDALSALRRLREAGVRVPCWVWDPPAALALMSGHGTSWDDFRRQRNPADSGRDAVGGRLSDAGPGLPPGVGSKVSFMRSIEGIARAQLACSAPGAVNAVWGHYKTGQWTAVAMELAGWEPIGKVTRAYAGGYADKGATGKPEPDRHRKGPKKGDYKRDPDGAVTRGIEGVEDGKFRPYLPVATEDWYLFRAPRKGKTLVDCFREHGTGQLRVGDRMVPRETLRSRPRGREPSLSMDDDGQGGVVYEEHDRGTRPKSLVLEHHPWCDDDACSPDCPVALTAASTPHRKVGGPGVRGGSESVSMRFAAEPGSSFDVSGDEGTAERFFTILKYASLDKGRVSSSSKSSTKEAGWRYFWGYAGVSMPLETTRAEYDDLPVEERLRVRATGKHVGCEHKFWRRGEGEDEEAWTACVLREYLEVRMSEAIRRAAGERFRSAIRIGNPHATVKPVEFMEWLVGLVAPARRSDGAEGADEHPLIVDVTAGSGSTGVAATRLGFRFLGVDRERLAERVMTARLEHAKKINDGEG